MYNVNMPSQNTIRDYDLPAYYHVYNRGAGSQPIFYDDQDRLKFLSLFSRYLDDADQINYSYEKYAVEIIAYCLMGNHFHLLLYQEQDIDAISKFMKSVTTAYSMYFNRKYKRSGHLFQGVFRAARITNQSYLLHITRYIHMNPRSYLRYRWSSLRCYLGQPHETWLNPERVNSMSPAAYKQFLQEYEGKKAELKLIKDQLAS